MLCSLLKAAKVFFVGNSIFSSEVFVHLDKNLSTVAITYHLEQEPLHIDHTITVIQDYRYQACFAKHPHTVMDHYLFLTPELREKLKNLDRLPVVVNDRHNDYHCVRRKPQATDKPQATQTPHVIKHVNKTEIHHMAENITKIVKQSPANRPSMDDSVSVISETSNQPVKDVLKKNSVPLTSSSPTQSSPTPTTSNSSSGSARRPGTGSVSPTLVVFRRTPLIGVSHFQHGGNVVARDSDRVHHVEHVVESENESDSDEE